VWTGKHQLHLLRPISQSKHTIQSKQTPQSILWLSFYRVECWELFPWYTQYSRFWERILCVAKDFNGSTQELGTSNKWCSQQ
jgi:hypothetical protein